jgi:transmembrane sensor
VVVTEGRVLAWSDHAPSHTVAVVRGGEAVVPLDGTAAPRAAVVDLDQALAWRRGEIGLDGQNGLEAAAEFNRYSMRPIRIRNPRAARYQLVGYFQTSQSSEFARALARLSHAKMTQNDNEIVIE